MSAPFTVTTGEPRKTEEIKKHVMPWMNARAGSLLGGILHAIGAADHYLAGDDYTTDGLEDARLSMMIESATGTDLDIIGQNYGIRRPLTITMPDALYREYIKTLAFKRKLTRKMIREYLVYLLGIQEDVGWDIYEIRPNTITIDLGDFVAPSGPAISTYLRGTVALTQAISAADDFVVISEADTNSVQVGDEIIIVGTGEFRTITSKVDTGGGEVELHFTDPIPDPYSLPLSISLPSSLTHPGDYLLADASELSLTDALAGSTVENLSIWLGSSAYPIFEDLLTLVRAAGVDVEFKKRSE